MDSSFSGKFLKTLILFSLSAMFSPLTHADIIKKGTSDIPGTCNPKRQVKWRVAFSKTPYGNMVQGNQIHFWLDLELCNPMPGDDIRFVICSMINVLKPKINMPRYKANVDSNTGIWTCSADGTANWYPNYHFGCRRVRLTGASPKSNVIDQTVTLSVPFAEADLATPYIDLAVDCPNGFVGCGDIENKPDRFLTPGDGLFPQNGAGCNGTSSWWILNKGGNYNSDLSTVTMSFLVPTGNWYTMALPERSFASRLNGTFSDLPPASLVEINFPESTQGGRNLIEATDSILEISLPFEIGPGLMEEEDEHTRVTVTFPVDEAPARAETTIRFLGEVIATAPSTFPDGSPLFEPGQIMHYVDLQGVPEFTPPVVLNPSFVPVGGGFFEVRVEGEDEATMATGAAVGYSLGGSEELFVPLDYDLPAEVGERTRFRGIVGPIAPESEIDAYTLYLVDDAGNIASFNGRPSPRSIRLVPHITRPGGNFNTRFFLNNPNYFDATYQFTGFSENGMVSSVVSGSLGAFSTQAFTVEDLFGTDDVSHFEISDESAVFVNLAYQAAAEGRAPAHLNETRLLSRGWRVYLGDLTITYDALALLNKGNSSAAVEICLINRDAGKLETLAFAVNPEQKALILVSDFFNAYTPDDYLDIVASQPMAITALRGDFLSTAFWENSAIPLPNSLLELPGK